MIQIQSNACKLIFHPCLIATKYMARIQLIVSIYVSMSVYMKILFLHKSQNLKTSKKSKTKPFTYIFLMENVKYSNLNIHIFAIIETYLKYFI